MITCPTVCKFGTLLEDATSFSYSLETLDTETLWNAKQSVNDGLAYTIDYNGIIRTVNSDA